MRPYFSLVMILIAATSFSSCFSTTSKTHDAGINSKPVYGGPKAYITKDVIPSTTTDGPVAYAPNIPAISLFTRIH